MTTGVTTWTVRLTATAERDFSSIIRWSTEQFGQAQARTYANTLSMALQDLIAGPTLIDVKIRDDIVPGLMTLHVARKRRKGRHFIMFRVADCDGRVIDVLRLLHDAMDLPQHSFPFLANAK